VIWRPHFDVFKNNTSSNKKRSKSINKFGANEVTNFLINLQSARFSNKNIEKVVSKKLKRYPIYKLVQNNGQLLTKFKYTNLDGFKKHFGINKTNKIVGYTPDYVGATPSNIVYNDNVFTKFILDKSKEIKTKCSKSFFIDLSKSITDTRVEFSTGYTSVHSHLKEFLKDDTSDLKACDIINFLKLTNNKWIHTPHVSFYDAKELDYMIRVNLDADPGHYTSKLINGKKRNTNLISRVVAKMLYNNLKKIPIKNFYLWKLLGREKDIKLTTFKNDNVDVDCGSRAIMSTEDPMCTLLMWFAQKVQVGLSNETNKTFNVSGEYNIGKATKIYEHERNYDFKLEADWTFYDSNVNSEMIKAASMLLLSGLPKDKLHDRIRYTITKSILTKYLVLPPGIVVELNRGVPSGHPFTTLINCTVNTIYWSLIGREIYGDNYQDFMKIEVYGDDSYVLFKNNKNLKKIDDIINELGLKSEPLLPELKLCNFDYEKHELPDFLKRRYFENNLIWNHKKLIDKLMYQSKKRSLNDQIELLLSYYNTAPFDKDLIIFIKLFYDWLIIKYGKIHLKQLNSYLYMEELVNQGSESVSLNKRFKISKINEIKFDLDNKFKNLLSMSGVYLKYERQLSLSNIMNETQINLLYGLAFPPDFTVRNKFIFNYDLDKINFEEKETTYHDQRQMYIREIELKLTNELDKMH
jgi:hypothetical protein